MFNPLFTKDKFKSIRPKITPTTSTKNLDYLQDGSEGPPEVKSLSNSLEEMVEAMGKLPNLEEPSFSLLKILRAAYMINRAQEVQLGGPTDESYDLEETLCNLRKAERVFQVAESSGKQIMRAWECSLWLDQEFTLLIESGNLASHRRKLACPRNTSTLFRRFLDLLSRFAKVKYKLLLYKAELQCAWNSLPKADSKFLPFIAQLIEPAEEFSNLYDQLTNRKEAFDRVVRDARAAGYLTLAFKARVIEYLAHDEAEDRASFDEADEIQEQYNQKRVRAQEKIEKHKRNRDLEVTKDGVSYKTERKIKPRDRDSDDGTEVSSSTSSEEEREEEGGGGGRGGGGGGGGA